ncbi:MAG: four helix bundle protein [Prevotella sp.]|nr:four helix bundle protein [Prevotella sp.]
MTNNFHGIYAWQKAHEFVLMVYKTTKSFPDFEKFGLCSQFQRAAVSIPANIAEGYKKMSRADKLRFYNIAQGSLEECRYYILLSKDLGYISNEEYNTLLDSVEETSKLLNGYCKGVMEHDFSKHL